MSAGHNIPPLNPNYEKQILQAVYNQLRQVPISIEDLNNKISEQYEQAVSEACGDEVAPFKSFCVNAIDISNPRSQFPTHTTVGMSVLAPQNDNLNEAEISLSVTFSGDVYAASELTKRSSQITPLKHYQELVHAAFTSLLDSAGMSHADYPEHLAAGNYFTKVSGLANGKLTGFDVKFRCEDLEKVKDVVSKRIKDLSSHIKSKKDNFRGTSGGGMLL